MDFHYDGDRVETGKWGIRKSIFYKTKDGEIERTEYRFTHVCKRPGNYARSRPEKKYMVVNDRCWSCSEVMPTNVKLLLFSQRRSLRS